MRGSLQPAFSPLLRGVLRAPAVGADKPLLERASDAHLLAFYQMRNDDQESQPANYTSDSKRDTERLNLIESALMDAGWGKTVFHLNGFKVSVFPEGFHVAKDSFSDPIIHECDLRTALDTLSQLKRIEEE